MFVDASPILLVYYESLQITVKFVELKLVLIVITIVLLAFSFAVTDLQTFVVAFVSFELHSPFCWDGY